MNSTCHEFIDFISRTSDISIKTAVSEKARKHFQLASDRSILYCDSFAVRFCYSRSSSGAFSNTALALSTLEKYDYIPVFVVVVRRDAPNMILLANSTFIRKISHSSQMLAMDNIRGSFNGSDIIRDYDGITNSPENFDELFGMHKSIPRTDNLERIVEATTGITPRAKRFVPADSSLIALSVDRAIRFVASKSFIDLESDLQARCDNCRNEVMVASHIENVNIRGRLIEALITADEGNRARLLREMADIERQLPSFFSANGLGDYHRTFADADTFTDVKTKVVYLDSSPKGYNIDKFLETMERPDSVYLLFFIGIDNTGIFNTALCSVYHSALIDGTVMQYHWAGRASRGATQFRGSAINAILTERPFVNVIDRPKALGLLGRMLSR